MTTLTIEIVDHAPTGAVRVGLPRTDYALVRLSEFDELCAQALRTLGYSSVVSPGRTPDLYMERWGQDLYAPAPTGVHE